MVKEQGPLPLLMALPLSLMKLAVFHRIDPGLTAGHRVKGIVRGWWILEAASGTGLTWCLMWVGASACPDPFCTQP